MLDIKFTQRQRYYAQISSCLIYFTDIFLQIYSITSTNPELSDIVKKMKDWSEDNLAQFLLECRFIPDIVQMANMYGDGNFDTMFKISQTICYSIHCDFSLCLTLGKCF